MVLSKRDIDRPLSVLVATPAGGIGKGGIDRIMAALKAQLERQVPDKVHARFLATRGNSHLAFAWTHLLRFCGAMAIGRLRNDIDLVHINLASNGSTYRKLVVAGCARLFGIPYIIHLHGAEYRSFWTDKDTALNRRIRGMFANASRIVVLGTPWQSFVEQRAPEARRRIVVVANAVERPRLPHVGGGEKVHILFLGRVEERKGVPGLVRALARMRDVPGWYATIAGDGAVVELRQQLAALGLESKVTAPGWLGPEATARMLATGDILTLPSLAENLPMSIIEAMASGLGIVATPVGAVEDIVKDEETGLLVQPGNDAGLATALKRLVNDRELRQRLGANAQAFQRQNLSIEPYADKMCAVWRDAVATRVTPAELTDSTAAARPTARR